MLDLPTPAETETFPETAVVATTRVLRASLIRLDQDEFIREDATLPEGLVGTIVGELFAGTVMVEFAEPACLADIAPSHLKVIQRPEA